MRRRPTRREISEEEYDEEEHVPTPTPSCRVTRSKRAEPLKSTDAHLASSPAGVEKGATVTADNVPDVDPGEGTDDAVVASDYVKPVSQKPRVVEVIDGEEEHVPKSLKDDVEDSDAAEVEACTPTATGSGTKSCRPARSSDLDKDVEVEIEAREPARKKRRKNSRTTPPDALDPPHNSAPLVDGKLESTQDRREENYDIFAADTRKGRAAPETRKNHAEMDTRKQLAEERSDRGRGESNTERRLLMMEDHFKEMFRRMKGFEKKLDEVAEVKNSLDTLHKRVDEVSEKAVKKVEQNFACSKTPRCKRKAGHKQGHKTLRITPKKEYPSDSASHEVMSAVGSESDSDEERARPGSAADPDTEDDENDERPNAIFMRKMIAQVPHVKLAFSYDNLYPCYLRCMLAQLIDMMDDEKVHEDETYMRLSPAGLADYLDIVVYSRKANEKKEVFHAGLGPSFMDLKFRVLCLCLLRAQKNAFGDFKPIEKDNAQNGAAGKDAEEAAADLQHPEDDGDGHQSQSDRNDKKDVKPKAGVDENPEFPFWLDTVDGERYMTEDHIQNALRIAHTSGASAEIYPKKLDIAAEEADPEQDDISLFATTIAERRLKKFLHASRKCVGIGFFRTLGFVYGTWSDVPTVKSDQSSLKMEWLTGIDFNPEPGRDDFPKMVTFGEQNAFAINEERYNNFAKTRHELIILITHECLNRPAGFVTKKRSRRGTINKTLPRPVNLLDVALQILHVASFAALSGDRKYVLSGHENSLGAVYAVAIALRKILTARKGREITPPAGVEALEGGVDADLVDRVMESLSAKKSQEKKNLGRIVDSVMHKDFQAMQSATEKWRKSVADRVETSQGGRSAADRSKEAGKTDDHLARQREMAQKLSAMDW